VGGIPEIVIYGKTRYLAPQDDINTLNLALLTSPSLRDSLGKSVYVKVQQNYSHELMVNRYINYTIIFLE